MIFQNKQIIKIMLMLMLKGLSESAERKEELKG